MEISVDLEQQIVSEQAHLTEIARMLEVER